MTQDYQRLVLEAQKLREAAATARANNPSLAKFQALQATVADMQRRAQLRESQLRRATKDVEASHAMDVQMLRKEHEHAMEAKNAQLRRFQQQVAQLMAMFRQLQATGVGSNSGAGVV